MSAPHRAAWWAPLAWPLGAAALALLALAWRGAAPAAWDWQPGLWAREPWRAWTAVLVHWSDSHLAMNLAGCAALAWLGWRAGAGRREALAWALAWPLTQWGLLTEPALRHYGGLSGVLHAGVAVLLWRLLTRGPGRERAVGLGLAAGLVVKLWLEAPWRGALRVSPDLDFAVAPLAHLSGTLAGLACAAALCRRARPDPETGSPA